MVFETNLQTKSSNHTTGNVTFQMPQITNSSKRFTITATTVGGLHATHTIDVYQKKRTMTLGISPNPVFEQDTFTLTLQDADQPLSNTTIWFYDTQYTTDINGTLTLTAPDVLVNITYGILAVKSGYPSTSSQITILENKKGMQLMEIIAPLLVSPGQNTVEITVLSLSGGVENATISMYNDGTEQATYQTNAQGKTYLSAPQSSTEDKFSIHVEKEGYTTYTGNQRSEIYLFEQDLTSDLILSLYPSEVNEGATVRAEVVDDVGVAVPEVTLWRGETILSEKTDNQGILTFSAPSVFMDREFYLYAVKAGYNYDTQTLTVRNKPSHQKPIQLTFNSSVNETDDFQVTVTDETNQSLSSVQIQFDTSTYQTDQSGTVTLVAPEVAQTTFYSIEANKYGYLPATAMIEIRQTDQQTTTPSSRLIIYAPSNIIENDPFTITVRNDQGIGIAGAHIRFDNTLRITDSQGTASFVAPATEWDTTEQISVSKNGYQSSTADITITNTGGFSMLFLLIILIGILVTGALYYFRTRHLY